MTEQSAPPERAGAFATRQQRGDGSLPAEDMELFWMGDDVADNVVKPALLRANPPVNITSCRAAPAWVTVGRLASGRQVGQMTTPQTVKEIPNVQDQKP